MRLSVLLILMVCFIKLSGQTKFEPGYFINNQGEKVNCLIKNFDWYKNPTDIQYQLDETSSVITDDISNIQEFSVNTYIFKRIKVAMDRASDVMSSLDRSPQPNLNDEELFLQLIVDGQAQLYRYRATNLTRFFLKSENSEVEQLVYKRYFTNQNNVGTNDTYRRQLLAALQCEDINLLDVKDISYKERDISAVVLKYNKCKDPNYSNIEDTRKKGYINLYLRPGLHYATAEIRNSSAPSLNRDFEPGFGYRIGVEIEGILPANNDKWALVVEPTFQSISMDQENENTTSFVSLDYSSIQLPIGVRYRMYVSDQSIIYINTFFLLDFQVNSSVNFEPGNDLELFSSNALLVGIGYNYDNRYSIEVRSGTSRNVLRGFVTYKADYTDFGLYFGYNLINR